MTNNAAGGKAELHDFLPIAAAKEPETIDDFLDRLMGMSDQIYGD